MGLAVLLAACSPGGEEVDMGQPVGAVAITSGPEVDITDLEVSADAPPADATLWPGGWPEATAFIARETEAGRPTVVNVFASWCEPCEREIPLILAAAADNPDVAFLGIDHEDPLDQAASFLRSHDVDIPTIHDLDGDVMRALGGRGLPTTVVFDGEGRLVGRVLGELTGRSLDQLLDLGRVSDTASAHGTGEAGSATG